MTQTLQTPTVRRRITRTLGRWAKEGLKSSYGLKRGHKKTASLPGPAFDAVLLAAVVVSGVGYLLS
jgi:hypothetical protein